MKHIRYTLNPALPPTTPDVAEVAYGTTLPADALYSLVGAAINEPIGPVAGDPTAKPKYIDPNNPAQYLYPNGTIALAPFLLSLLRL